MSQGSRTGRRTYSGSSQARAAPLSGGARFFGGGEAASSGGRSRGACDYLPRSAGSRHHGSVKVSARVLHRKALSSMRCAMTAFNSPHDDGRTTAVLLHLQHAFEMLLKAALVQGSVKVFDKDTERSIGFEKALSLTQQLPGVKLTDAEAGTLRAIDALRNDEQHWYTDVPEGLLYLHARAAVTLFDNVLHRAFNQRLADHLPQRVLPISTEPPQEFQTLVDSEYALVGELLKPRKRQRDKARARIRALLAMEAHAGAEAKVSNLDVNRIEKGVKAGKSREELLPNLSGIGAQIVGEGLTVQVRFSRTEGLPVRYVGNDEDAAGIRQVDLQAKYHWTPSGLAEKLKIDTTRAKLLREHLGIDHNEDESHEFRFNRTAHRGFSDNALRRMREALVQLDMDVLMESHSKVKRRKPRPACAQPGCALVATRAKAAS